MLFRVFITGIFAGSLAAVLAFTNGYGLIFAGLSYAMFGALAIMAFGVVSFIAPKQPTPSRQWQCDQARKARDAGLWHPMSHTPYRKSPAWRAQLAQSKPEVTVQIIPYLFSSSRPSAKSQP